MKQKKILGQKIICLNRKASFNYFFIELLEAGILLKGSEVKSLRDGKGSIADSYAVDNNGELFLINSHIPLHRQSSYNNHDPKGNRKLLLNRKEINKLIGKINQEGLTLIPTKLYFVKGKVKVEIAVAKGKKLYDKRQVKKTRDWNRERARLLSKNNK
jgi:SsrA-binding protein